MNEIYVVFDYRLNGDVMAFETAEMAQSFIAHPANSQRMLDYQRVPFRYADSDIDIPEFMR